MTEQTQMQAPHKEANVYASREDFHTIFNEDLRQLYQLSFLLTRDPAKAERCLVVGLEDCVRENRVFREWARSWAKRVIVQNAIREMKPRPIHSNSRLSNTSFSEIEQLSSPPDRHFALEAVLNLKISSGLYSLCPSWSTTRIMTVPFCSGAQLEKSWRLVAALLGNWWTQANEVLLRANLWCRRSK